MTNQIMSDERNFRSFYYEKVGCKTVEEKKSLEILFRDKIWDREKINQFCSRFLVPCFYRSTVWKFLLGVIPSQKSSHEFIMKERSIQYNDLLECLKSMKFITESSPKEEKFLEMWLMEKYNLIPDRTARLNVEFHQSLLAITHTLMGIFEDDVDVYWIARGFYDYVESWCSSIPNLIENTKVLLNREDSALYSHLEEFKLMDEIPFKSWFERCFAGVLHDYAVVKLWDRLIGGSYRLLVFICAVMLITMRDGLFSCINYSQFLSCIQSVTNDTSLLILSKSIEMWSFQGRSMAISPVQQHKPIPAPKLKRKFPSPH